MYTAVLLKEQAWQCCIKQGPRGRLFMRSPSHRGPVELLALLEAPADTRGWAATLTPLQNDVALVNDIGSMCRLRRSQMIGVEAQIGSSSGIYLCQCLIGVECWRTAVLSVRMCAALWSSHTQCSTSVEHVSECVWKSIFYSCFIPPAGLFYY